MLQTDTSGNCNLELWQRDRAFQSLTAKLKSKHAQALEAKGIVNAALPSFLAALQDSFPDRQMIFVSREGQSSALSRLTHQLERLLPQRSVALLAPSLHFPLSGQGDLQVSQPAFIRLLSSLHSPANTTLPPLSILSPSSLLQILPTPAEFCSLRLRVGEHVNSIELMKQLSDMGYHRTDNVLEIGSLALRGEILDIFPSNSPRELPLRIVFFGDEIESIKYFEPWNQRSLSGIPPLDSINISPCLLFTSWQQELEQHVSTLETLSTELDETQKVFWQQDLNRLLEGEWFHFLPYLYQDRARYVSLASYVHRSCQQQPVSMPLLITEEIHSIEQYLQQHLDKWLSELELLLERQALPTSQADWLKDFVKLPLQYLRQDLPTLPLLNISL